MSGHSKWSTIKHKKGAADAKRGKIFSRLAKELTVLAKQGGGDPTMNPSLRTVIQKAKAANMPSDNVDRAIKKGTGEIESAALDELTYEGYTAGGVGLIVIALTDNKNRAAAEIRHIFTKHGSSLAQQGSVSRGFERKGQFWVSAQGVNEDDLMNIVLEAGAEDMRRDGDDFEIITDPGSFVSVNDALTKAGIQPASSEVTLRPLAPMPISDKAVAAAVMRFVDALEDNDDVQAVYTNMDVDDAIMAALESGS